MKNQIVIPTGYMGSGSSAITDLLSEIEGYRDNNGSYEYILMHCPDGLFDLEDKLLYSNNAIRSDEAIQRFLICMNDLYQKKFYWPGRYKKKISTSFMDYCHRFINSLNPIESTNTYWYFQEYPTGMKMYIIYILQKILKSLNIHKIVLSTPLRYKKMRIAIPQKEEYFCKARLFLNNIFNDLGYNSKNLVLDQFLLPHNLFRIKNYFDESLRVFVVARDPRDVFIINKYIWVKMGTPVPYPLNVKEFCKMYRAVRESEKKVIDRRIFRLNFEDLIFDYEKILLKIYTFLGISEEKHQKYKKTIFNPNISINNTMLFKKNLLYKQEIEIIEKELIDYLYDFPSKYPFNDQMTGVF